MESGTLALSILPTQLPYSHLVFPSPPFLSSHYHYSTLIPPFSLPRLSFFLTPFLSLHTHLLSAPNISPPSTSLSSFLTYHLISFSPSFSFSFTIHSSFPFLFPLLLRTSEKNPIVSMCVIGNYQSIAECVGPEFIASSILPTIQPMLVDRYASFLYCTPPLLSSTPAVLSCPVLSFFYPLLLLSLYNLLFSFTSLSVPSLILSISLPLILSLPLPSSKFHPSLLFPPISHPIANTPNFQ